jgi:alpha/beta superfamily hydrolase
MTFETRESVTLVNKSQKIFGILHLPSNVDKAPAVIFCHGLGGDKSGRHRLYVKVAEGLSKIGIASLRIDFRGAGDSEGHFQEMTVESQVSDVLVALEFLQSHPKIIQDKIGYFGRSFGGIISLLAAERSQCAASIVVWAPLFNGEQWRERWDRLTKGMDVLSEDEKYELLNVNGDIPAIALYEQMFELKTEALMEKLWEVPFLHIYGERDSVIAAKHTLRYEQYRGKAHAESKFIRYPETDHDFTHPAEQVKAVEET